MLQQDIKKLNIQTKLLIKPDIREREAEMTTHPSKDTAYCYYFRFPLTRDPVCKEL